MSDIGAWVRRLHFGVELRPSTLWHLVESEIGDRLVTHCGRQLRHDRDRPFEYAHVAPDQAVCSRCAL